MMDWAESSSPWVQQALSLCRLYAPLQRPILFLGAVGVGKTTLARLAHEQSDRPGAFVPVSAGELSDTLYADTLFGHVKGAFTDASSTRTGVVEQAAQGTLLIDDVALLPVVAQAALLRVVETGSYRPLGGGDRVASCRFFFASTIGLEELRACGALLPDLESRMGELTITVPELRHRSDDIPALGRRIAIAFLREHGFEGSVDFTDEAKSLLLRYAWPRNLRELVHVIERAVVHAGPAADPVVVTGAHLPERFLTPEESDDASPPLTRGLVESVLHASGGNQSEAARRLNVHRNTIARYLRDAG